jgi:uncharacterized protein
MESISMAISVTALYRYPVKSAGSTVLAEADVTPRGFAHDRRWMVIDFDGKFITQRTHPRLALVTVDVTVSGLVLGLGSETVCLVRLPEAISRLQVTVWNDVVEALDAGEAPAAWLTRLLGTPCRLVYMAESTRRRVDPAYGAPEDVVSFADAYPVLVTTEASLAELNGRIEHPVSMARFRPNIVLDGAIPYEEDTWRVVQIGEVRFRLVKPCARCAIITLDAEAGVFQKEPLRTLATYRQRNGKVYFGQNAIPDGIGRISIGDTVRVLE